MKAAIILTMLLSSNLVFGQSIECARANQGEANFFSLNSKFDSNFFVKYFIFAGGLKKSQGGFGAESGASPIEANCAFTDARNFHCDQTAGDGYIKGNSIAHIVNGSRSNAISLTFGARSQGDIFSDTFELTQCKLK